jgi:hypothetical protein
MNLSMIRKLRLASLGAMVGCTLAGALLGWLDLPVDPRWGGAALGALWVSLKFHWFV